MTLFALINSKSKDLHKDLKSAFMPYTEAIEVDELEEEAVTILLNLSSSKNLLDVKTAKEYLLDDRNFVKAISEIKWFHTFNLKYPDPKVKNQRVLILKEQDFDKTIFGWAHNSALYPHVKWLLSLFIWKKQKTSLLHLIFKNDPFWANLLKKFGLTEDKQKLIKQEISEHLTNACFPQKVSLHSTQVVFPYDRDYISITPVVNHEMQASVQIASRNPANLLRFRTLSLHDKRPTNIGNLCGSLAGNIKFIFAPAGCKPDKNKTFLYAKKFRSLYFNDFELTNKKICRALNDLITHSPFESSHQKKHSRKHLIKELREHITLWLSPLIEARESMESKSDRVQFTSNDELAQKYIICERENILSLRSEFNQRIHETFQSNKYSRKFAYHPWLLKAVQSQVDWILKRLTISFTNDQSADEQYIYLSSLQVHQANAVSCPYLVGVPSLTAVWGFIHKFESQFRVKIPKDEEVEFKSFAFFIHSENVYASTKGPEPNRAQAKDKIPNVIPPTARKEFFTDLEFDLVIKVLFTSKLDEYLPQLRSSMPSVLFGASLIPPLIEKKISWLEVYQSRSALHSKIKLLPCYGKWLIPNKKIICSVDHIAQETKNRFDQIPVAIGYEFLESPLSRENSRANKHVFAENIIGIATKINPIKYRFLNISTFFDRAFWRLITSQTSIFVMKESNKDDVTHKY